MATRDAEFVRSLGGGEGRGGADIQVWRWSGLLNGDVGALIPAFGWTIANAWFVGTQGSGASFRVDNVVDGIGSLGGSAYSIINSAIYSAVVPGNAGLRDMMLEFTRPRIVGGTGTNVDAYIYLRRYDLVGR